MELIDRTNFLNLSNGKFLNYECKPLLLPLYSICHYIQLRITFFLWIFFITPPHDSHPNVLKSNWQTLCIDGSFFSSIPTHVPEMPSYCVFSFLPIGIFSFILYQRKSNTRYKMCYFCHSFTLEYFNFTGFLMFSFILKCSLDRSVVTSYWQ